MKPEWTAEGWLEEATAWIEEQCRARGISPAAAPEPVRPTEQCTLACVLRVATDSGVLFFKACIQCPPLEPQIAKMVADRFPGNSPEVLAIDEARSWILMREVPAPDIMAHDKSLAMPEWSATFRHIAEIHNAYAGRHEELLEMGVPDMRPATLRPGLARNVEVVARGSKLTEEEARAWASAEGRLDELLGLFAESAIPPTLLHGDMHPWNLFFSRGRPVVFDWSLFCVGNPLCEIGHFWELGRTYYKDMAEPERPASVRFSDDGDNEERLIGEYLEVFQASAVDARALARAMKPVSLYCRICNHQRFAEPGEDLDLGRWVRMLLASLDS